MLSVIKGFLLVVILMLQAIPALAANLCDDLWLSRNAVFDSAGFCFRSPLGQALFDNKGCKAGAPIFSDAQQENIAGIVAMEAQNNCSLNTNRRSLNVDALGSRKQLETQPLAAKQGVICSGYVGPVAKMRTAPSLGAKELVELSPGDSLTLMHQADAGWSYVTIGTGESLVGGWVPGEPDTCEAWSDREWEY